MSHKSKGILLAAGGSSLWGISGIFAQVLFDQYAASPEWLVSTRLFFAGLLILMYSHMGLKNDIFHIFKVKADALRLVLFGVVGMVGCQYFFFKSIEMSGASLATILQFISPIFVYGYLLLSNEKEFRMVECAFVFATVVGVFLIVTNGQWNQMSISAVGLLVGLASAIGAAFYMLQPRKLFASYESPTIVGWGMLIGGGIFQFVEPFWSMQFVATISSALLLSGVVLFGTALSFLAYLSSLRYIEASLSSVLAALEPLIATLLTLVVFGSVLGSYQLSGIFLVLISVVLLSTYSKKEVIKETADETIHVKEADKLSR